MQDNNSSEEPQYGGSTDIASEAVQTIQKAMNGPVEGIQASEAEGEAEVAPETQEPVKTEQEQRFAAKFAALSRKEKQIKQQEAKLQQQMNDLQAKLQQFEEQQKSMEPLKAMPDRLKKEPFKVLKEQGFTIEQITEMMLNDGELSPETKMTQYEQRIQEKLQALEQKLAEKEAKEQQEKYEAALSQFKAQLTDFVNKDETYELIKANDAVDVVFELIEQHHQETGEILSNEEACNAVEEHLLEEAKKLVDREKVKKLLQPEPKKPAPAQGAGKSSPTLSNAQAAQASKKPSRTLSDEESKAEAAKLIRWMD